MRNRLFKLSQESDEILDDNEVVTADEVSEDSAELQKKEQELDTSDQEVKQAMEAVASLECLCSTLSQTTEVTPQVAAVTEVALESIYQSIGVSRPRSITFEAEETTTGSRVARIKEQIKRILMAIAEAFRRAMDWVNDYFLQVTSAAARLEKYAAGQLKKLRAVKNNRIQEAVLTNKSLAKRLYTENGKLVDGMIAIQQFTTDAAATALGDHVKVMNEAIDAFVSHGEGNKDIAKLMSTIPAVLEKAFSGVFALSGSSAPVQLDESYNPKGTTVYSTKWMVGDYIAMLVMPDDIDTLSKLAFYIRPNPDPKEVDTLNYLNPDDVEKLLKSVIATCSIVRNFEKSRKGLEAFQGSLTKAVTKLSKGDIEFSDQDRQFLKSLQAMAPMIAKGIHQRVFGFALNTCGAVSKFADLCIKNLEAKPAA